MPINPVPPPEHHIILVGFGHFDNGRSCEVHPGGCGDVLVLSKEDFGVGMLLRIHNSIPNELAVHVIKRDGTNGCRVGFAKREYATEENVQKYDGVTVRLVNVFTRYHENQYCRHLAHKNFVYADAEIIIGGDVVLADD
jgi:hypothetical protein